MRKSTKELILEYRGEIFAAMGFSEDQARDLASTKIDGWPVDTQRVKKVLHQGCSLDKAFAIFGPL